jgi:hypothetical protein
MKPVANLVIEMAANVARLEKDMQSARRSVDGAMQKIQRSAQMAMRALGALGLGLGAAQLTSFVKSAIDAGDRMQKLSQQTGIAVQNIAGLQLAFRQGGGTAADMEMAINRLVIGMDKQGASFKKLNIQSTDTFGALSEISNIFQKMPDGAEKSALANDLFGRSGARLIPILNQGAEGLQSYIELSNRLGTSVTPEVAKQFEKYNDTMDTVGAAMEGLAMQAATSLVPVLQSVADTLISLFESGAVKRGVDSLVTAFQLLAVVMTSKVIEGITGVIGRTITMTATLTAATAATRAYTIAQIGMSGVMALMGGPVGIVVTAASALIYFTEEAFKAETTTDGLAKSLNVTNAEMVNMTKIQIEKKIIDVALELQKLEIQLLEAALAQDALNESMSDPEAYAFEGGKISTQMNFVNKRSAALFNILERLKQQLVDTNKETTNTGNGLGDLGNSATKTAETITKLIEKYRLETDALVMSTEEKERAAFTQALLNEGIKEGTQSYKEYLDLFNMARLERRTLESQLKYIEEEKKANEKRLADRIAEEEKFAQEAQKINDQIGQSLTDALVNGGQSAKDFISNMFKTLILRPILQPIISGTLGALGVGAAGAAFGGTTGGAAGGGMDIFGLGSALKSGYDVLSGGFTAVGNAASSLASSMLGADAAALAFMEGTGATATAAAGQLSSISATAASVGAAATVLAGVAAGLAAGSFISGEFSFFGGNQMIATAGGTAIGAAIGTYILPGIGTAIGAAIGGTVGGLVNRAFGRGPKETQAAGITGTLNVLGGELQAFSDWRQKGGWFRSSKSGTQLTQLDVELSNFFSGSTQAIGASVSILANSIGQSAENIGQFSQQIRLDLLNLSDEEAQARISEALNDFSNNLVNFVVPSIQFMAKSGETATETLTRLSSSLLSVNRAFAMLDIKVLDLSLNSAQAASNLVDLTGGIDGFTQKIDFFYQNFVSAQDRANLLTAQATDVFNQLGIAMPTTRDGFKQLFDVIAGSGSASLTAALLNIAPVINEVIGFTEQLEQANRQVSDAIRNERLGLEQQILQVLGDTVTLRERELLALDASNRALQLQLYGIADAEGALSEAINATDIAFGNLQQSLSVQLNNTLADLQKQFDALTNSLNQQVTAAQASQQVANQNLGNLRSIFSLLDREINSLLNSTLTAQTASQGLAFITRALATAQQTGYLPDQEQLSSAISAARGGLGTDQFTSAFEQRRATLSLTNQLVQLQGITAGQTTATERQLQVAEEQLLVLYARLEQAAEQYAADQEAARSDFDRQLDLAQNQINALRDVDDSVFGVEQAIKVLGDRIDAERASMTFLQQQMINLQQDANARAAAEIERQNAERLAAETRAAQEAQAIRDAKAQADARAAADAQAAEEQRQAAAQAKAEADARAAAAAVADAARLEAIRLANQEGVFGGTFLGDLLGIGGGSTSYDPNADEYGNVVEDNYSYNAEGGRFQGGLSMVGEEGPEMVNFARPSMIYTAGETAEIFNGGSKTNDVAYEVRQLRQENQAQSRAMVSLQARMTRLIERWDGDGLPEERYEDATA